MQLTSQDVREAREALLATRPGADEDQEAIAAKVVLDMTGIDQGYNDLVDALVRGWYATDEDVPAYDEDELAQMFLALEREDAQQALANYIVLKGAIERAQAREEA